MRSPHTGHEPDGPDGDESAILAYQELCQSGQPSLERFWAKLGPGRPLTLLSSLVKVELQCRFARGERPRAAEYLARFPHLAEFSDRVVSMVYEEFCLLEEAGARPDPSDFVEVYGEWRDSLLSQLVYHRELSQVAGVTTPNVKFPLKGDRFASYHLRSILGTGGTATVYLATDEELGDRRVALKISASVGREPSILANLDHRSIVPILNVTQSDEAGLRGFCMPYRPGVTLEELIRRIGRGQVPRKAKAIWDQLEPVGDEDTPCPAKLDREGWTGFPVRGSYSEAVAWIGLVLTNALVYLHDRGIRHRDIKPANVLLAYREGPQLLDFNLAHDRVAAEQAQAAMRGGTLPYMAPEQLRAFLDPDAWEEVDSPADIYALGLILRELVAGTAPELPNRHLSLPRAIRDLLDRRASPGIPVRKINPSLPPAIESIIARCLAFEPEDRYATADDLAEDLKRFLDRRPLKVAENTSMIERGANWFSRNRSRVAGATLCLALACAGLSSNTPRSIEQDPDFKKAVADFEAGTPILRNQAKTRFDRLHTRYPGSAWPVVYTGLINEDNGFPDLASENMSLACSLADVENVIDQILKTLPRSTTLYNTKGLYLFHHDRFDEARQALSLSSDLNPKKAGTLALLSKVEQRTGKTERAIDHLEQALRYSEGIEVDPSIIRSRRVVLLFLHAGLIDNRVEIAKGESDWTEIVKELDAMDMQLKRLDEDQKLGPKPADERFRLFVKDYYTGIVASTRGAFALRRLDYDLARREFQRSADSFAEAQTVRLDEENHGKYRGGLQRHSAQNQNRIDHLESLEAMNRVDRSP